MAESAELSRDAVFRLLSNPRRRYVLYFLRRNGGEARLEELTQSLAAWETGKDPEVLDDDDRKRVYVSLYQTHVPKLEEHGVVEYDTDSTVLTLTDTADQVDRYLTVDGSAVPWQRLYLSLAAVAAAVTALAVTDVGPFGVVAEPALTGVVVAAFVLLALAQYLYDTYSDRPLPEELRPD
jgi:hypothetical protein